MKYVSAQRLHRALSNLKSWGDRVGQKRTHLSIFLAVKQKGICSERETEYRDLDDKAYWNKFMRLSGDSKPFFDPVKREYRPKDYPHNSAFKARNDRWGREGYEIASRSGDNWQFAPDYVERLATNTLMNGGKPVLYPEPDLIAWLYRFEAFDDDAIYETARDRFREEFNLTAEELKGLFSEPALDGLPEDEEFFGRRRIPEALVAEIATTGESLDLPQLMDLVSEKSGPQAIEVDDVARLVQEGRGQLILQGPPGTGKTYVARQVAAKVLGAGVEKITSPQELDGFLQEHQVHDWEELPADAPGAWDIVQFHPSYNYEDFVRGISSEIEGGQPVFKAEDRTIAALCRLAERCRKPIVLIVDEINRGDISKVLGELIFALEYRGEGVRTPYSVDGSSKVTVPSNLYILATMNTADRSIALIDYAIRRRFDFIEVLPSRDALQEFLINAELTVETTDRVLALFDSVNGLLYGQPDYEIGHTYFMAHDTEEIARRFVFQTLPLLAEYRREGIVGENVRVKPVGWPREAGIPLVHPQPFYLADQVAEWL
ncbi:McrB family protein [Candidatus Poriferisocius sp.]|uniref:McrB family protein n=1 Tax=Candidatus Poriferisocius sp. TaxID=3101276 RepID=UPI003B59F7F7